MNKNDFQAGPPALGITIGPATRRGFTVTFQGGAVVEGCRIVNTRPPVIEDGRINIPR